MRRRKGGETAPPLAPFVSQPRVSAWSPQRSSAPVAARSKPQRGLGAPSAREQGPSSASRFGVPSKTIRVCSSRHLIRRTELPASLWALCAGVPFFPGPRPRAGQQGQRLEGKGRGRRRKAENPPEKSGYKKHGGAGTAHLQTKPQPRTVPLTADTKRSRRGENTADPLTLLQPWSLTSPNIHLAKPPQLTIIFGRTLNKWQFGD